MDSLTIAALNGDKGYLIEDAEENVIAQVLVRPGRTLPEALKDAEMLAGNWEAAQEKQEEQGRPAELGEILWPVTPETLAKCAEAAVGAASLASESIGKTANRAHFLGLALRFSNIILNAVEKREGCREEESKWK